MSVFKDIIFIKAHFVNFSRFMVKFSRDVFWKARDAILIAQLSEVCNERAIKYIYGQSFKSALLYQNNIKLNWGIFTTGILFYYTVYMTIPKTGLTTKMAPRLAFCFVSVSENCTNGNAFLIFAQSLLVFRRPFRFWIRRAYCWNFSGLTCDLFKRLPEKIDRELWDWGVVWHVKAVDYNGAVLSC